MTLPRSGLEGGAGVCAVGRGVGRVSASGGRAVRSESPRASPVGFESSPSRAGCGDGDVPTGLGFAFARAGSSAAGTPLSETTVRSFGMFADGGTLFMTGGS
jgi:hypothetical protein